MPLPVFRALCFAVVLAAPAASLSISTQVPPAAAIHAKRLRENLPIWVHAFTRSGSSTMMSMFSEAWGPKGVDSGTFALFEPCHPGDKVFEPLASEGCEGVVRALAGCDFKSIGWLANWNDLHSRTAGLARYNASAASAACSAAPLNVLKTAVNPALGDFPLRDRLAILDEDESLLMVDVVRDPRNIYASIMSTYPFNVNAQRNTTILTRICDSFAEGLRFKHDRMHRIVFEDFLRSPEQVMRRAYTFIGANFGAKQRDWIAAHVDANDCPDHVEHPFKKAYSDCRTDSMGAITAFASVLHDDEKDAFARHESCQELKRAWSLP